MNLDGRSFALSQITHLVASLNKKNYQPITSECRNLVQEFGLEVEWHFYRTLFSQIDFVHDKNSVSSQQQLLTQCCESDFFKRPNLASLVCFLIDNSLSYQNSLKPSNHLLETIAKALKFSPLQDIAFSLALLDSNQQEIRNFAELHARVKITELTDRLKSALDLETKRSLAEINSGSSTLHFVLLSLDRVKNSSLRRNFIKQLVEIAPKEIPKLYKPFLQDLDETKLLSGTLNSDIGLFIDFIMAAGPTSNLPEMVRDLGYKFTTSSDICRSHLVRLVGVNETMHAATVARIIGIMVRTHTGLDDSTTLQNMNATGTSLWDKEKTEPKTWNVDVFINAVHELQPTLHWKEIVYEFDHVGFAVKDRQGLIMLIKAIKLGFQVQGLPGGLPIEMFYRPWKCSEGQVTLFQQILRNPDVLCLADYNHHSVAIELMKAAPDMDNREIASWKCLELLDTLLMLAEAGHSVAVLEMIQIPKTHCPDVLTLGLIQINPPLTNFRSEVLSQLLQIFLNNHPNSAMILNYAWLSPLNLKGVVIHAMAEWYTKAVSEGDTEHNRLSRILDVAQDLKALSVLLNAKAVPFVIDLAVMASKRKYLNLDKWLNDQMREHGDNFVKAVIQYLQRKLPHLATVNGLPLKEEHFVKTNFPIEVLPIILSCLQTFCQKVPIPTEFKDNIISMVEMSTPLLARLSQQVTPSTQAALRGIRPLEAAGTIVFPQNNATGNNASSVRPVTRPGLATSAGNFFPQVSGGNDGLLAISSQLSGLNFGTQSGTAVSLASSAAMNLGSGLGPLVSTPGSPNRIFSTAGSALAPNASSTSELGNALGGTSPLFSGLSAGSNIFPTSLSISTTSASFATQNTIPASSASNGGMQTGIEQIRQGNIAQIFPDITAPIPRDVEDQANSYFQQIYNHPPHPTLSINEVLELLKCFQESNNQKERDVFTCMIKNLFEEYKYFPQYPEKELHITAQLFGGIIEHGLVNMVPLGLALRFVLDAIRKAPDSNMYYFGIAALDRFKIRLKDYPQYCQHIACIDHFKEFPPHLIKWVEYGIQSQTPPGDPPKGDVLPKHLRDIIDDQVNSSGSGANPLISMGSLVSGPSNMTMAIPASTKTTTTVTSTSVSSTIIRPTTTAIGGRLSIANTTNIDTLLNAKQKGETGGVTQAPSDKIQDKIAFIFNNLSLMNLQQKANDLKEILCDDFTKWLAQYLVMKRASIEPNFHTLYSNFLEVLGNQKLFNEVLTEAYSNIGILLSTDKSIANFSDRSLLKNLGHWLGLMTLARNKPILSVDLEIKPLIIAAYHNGQQELLYVVPFVAKVLESCAKSKVFKPPCPWTMGIMNLLAELHQEHDLKLNLKFEIEVLCKNLSLELSHLQPGSLLKEYDKLNKMLNFNNFGMKQQSSHAHHGTHLATSAATKFAIDSFGASNPSMALSTRAKLDISAACPGNLISLSTAASGLGMDMTAVSNSGILVGSSTVSMPPPMPPFGSGGTIGHTPSSGGMSLLAPQTGTATSPATMVPPTSSLTESASAPVLSELIQHQAVLRQIEPKFEFADIDTSNLNAIVPHIQIDTRLSLLKDQPDLLQLVKIAIEKSIQEWVNPVIERSIKVALTTTEHIIKKDFALDQDEVRMRAASHHMVRNLTAGMAMITCRDHLLVSIKTNLKNLIVTLTRNLTPQQSEAIDMTVSVIANDNVELACAFIQKKALEKAIPEIDQRLKNEYENRVSAKRENRHHFESEILKYQNDRMPDAIRISVGSVSQQQLSVYEDFVRNIPGFKPLNEREIDALTPKATMNLTGAGGSLCQPLSVAQPLTTPEECIAILDEVHSKVDPFVKSCTGIPSSPHMTNLHSLLEAMSRARSSKEPSAIITLLQKAVENLLQGLTAQVKVDSENLARYRDANLLVLRAISDPRAFGQTWANSKITQALIEAKEEMRYNLDAFDCLVRNGLINLFEYDKHLAAEMDNGDNLSAINFAMHICKMYLIDDRTNAHAMEGDLFGTIEMLQKIATSSSHPPEGISNLMEMLKISSERLEQNLSMTGPTAQLHSGIQQAREFEDPAGLLEKTEYLLREWVNAYHSRDAGKDSRQAFVVFVQLMNQHGILKTDDLITRFFRMSTQMCVDLCYRALNEPNNSPTLVRAKCFHTLDAYVRLITLLVKHSGETQNIVTKVNLLNKVLGIVAGVLLIDHDVRETEFQQVPYHRIFIMLFLELNSPDQILENINFPVLQAYYNMLHILKPTKAPGFAYAWLEIVSHRVFMGRILASTPAQKGWPMYAQLLVDLFKFLSPFLRNAELAKPVQRLYRGTLRVLLVLLHDFPEFLCDYHYGFCDVIPPNCIQMRNLILSAFPRNMRLPDPFTPNLKVEMLSEVSIAPRIVSNYAAMISPAFKKDLDSYLKNRSPVSFLSEVRDYLLIGPGDQPGNRYNIQLINALVMYVGTSAIQYIRSKGLTPNVSSIAHSSHMDIFQNLAVDLETEGRYLFLNCIANQLRYPNSHTQYFSCTLLYLFSQANTEAIQEQITRVLLERLIVNRPHPWGLLITFIELIKNPSFHFWQHEFVTCAPEIQKLFESVARSCMVQTMPLNMQNTSEQD